MQTAGCAKWCHRGVAGSIPDLDARFERAALRIQGHLHILYRRVLVRPRAKRVALNVDGGRALSSRHLEKHGERV